MGMKLEVYLGWIVQKFYALEMYLQELFLENNGGRKGEISFRKKTLEEKKT